jgi:hypothetical protein
VPKPKTPQTKSRFSPARRFRLTGRSITRRRGALRRIQTTRKDGGDIRAEWLALRTATGLASPGNPRGQSSLDTRGGIDSERQEERKVDPSSPPYDATSGQNRVDSVGTGADNPDMPATEPPDVSPYFRSEMAAIRAYYAARVAAARGSLPAGDIAAAVKALLNEEMVALRALAERWRVATERQRQEKPQRPAGPVQRKDDPKPS